MCPSSIKGFTLIEILVVMTIISFVAVMVGLFALDISDFGIFLGDTITAQQEVQQTFNVLLAELRSMGSGDNGAYAIAHASSSSFTFFSDIDGDGSRERIRYFLQGNILQRGIIVPTGNPAVYNIAQERVDTMVNDVITSPGTAPLFTYFDSSYVGSGSGLAHPIPVLSVRLVRAAITADHTPQTKESEVQFSVTARLRNISQ